MRGCFSTADGYEMETDCSMLIGADLALPALGDLRDSVVGKSHT